MRILHLIHNYPPEFLGGTERYLQALVAEQISRGDEVTIISGSEIKREKAEFVEESSSNPRVIRFYRSNEDSYTVNFRPSGFKEGLKTVIDSFDPEVVHVQHWFNLGNDVISFLRSEKRRVVLSLHDLYSGCARIFMIRPDGFFCGQVLPIPLERCVDCVAADFEPPDLEEQLAQRRRRLTREIESADVVIVPSESHRRMIRRARITSNERLTVLGHGLLKELPRQKSRLPSNVVRFGTWGHLSRVKGIPQLLDAFEILSKSYGERVEFHLFGGATDDYRKELDEKSGSLRMTLHGSFGPSDMAKIAETIDVAVFPSHAYESYSFVLDESWALGVPSVVSDRGALADRAKGICETVDVTDPEAIAETLARYIDEPDRIERVRARLPELPFTIENHTEILEGYYRGTRKSGPSQDVSS